MKIYLNDVEAEYATNEVLTFSNFPQLVTVEGDASGTRTKASVDITFNGSSTLSKEQYYIIINGVEVFGINDMEKVENNTFYFAPYENTTTNMAMCYTLAKALNNTSLANMYDIYTDRQVKSGNTYDTTTIHIVAKDYGTKYNIVQIDTDLPQYAFKYTVTESSDNDSLEGSKVICQVYIETDEAKQSDNEYAVLPFAAELEKTYIKDKVTFDISPILSNYTKISKVIEYNVVLTYLKDNTLTLIGEIHNIYNINGYYMENGDEYISNDSMVLQNLMNGEIRPYTNSTKLYYYDRLLIPIYNKERINRNITYDYCASDGTVLKSVTRTYGFASKVDVVDYMTDYDANEYYINVTIQGLGKLRFDNIRPLKYGELTNYTDIYFVNSMGGTSSVPFTSSIEEEFDVKSTTYNENLINHYNDYRFNTERVYTNEIETTLTLKTHIMDKNGIYAYRDMMRSNCITKIVKGKTFQLIVDDYEEEQVQKGLYQITVSFKYKV